MYNQAVQMIMHNFSLLLQTAQHIGILEVWDQVSYVTYYLQLWLLFFLHSSHSNSLPHLPSCIELKRHTLCEVWDLEHWMKFLVKLYPQKEPVAENCKGTDHKKFRLQQKSGRRHYLCYLHPVRFINNPIANIEFQFHHSCWNPVLPGKLQNSR